MNKNNTVQVKVDPYKSWYPRPKLTERQKGYIELLSRTFRVRSMKYNKVVPYIPTPWQEDFHANSVCAMPRSQWKDRFVIKGRGISFSVSAMIDLIMAANKFNDLIIPVVSHRYTTACDLITVGYDLIRLAEQGGVDLGFDIKKQISGTIYNKRTGCEIRAYPSSNVNALRSIRTYTGLLDEFNFYRDVGAVLDAAEYTITEGGAFTMGTTVYGHNDAGWHLFQDLSKPAKADLKKIFYLPAFEPTTFDISKPLSQQTNPIPLVWWLNADSLEDKRRRDNAGFLRENQCTPSDESMKFLSIQLILRVIDNQLINSYEQETRGMLFMGVDVATSHDYAVITIFEKTDFGIVQRYLWYSNKIELKELEELVLMIDRTVSCDRIRVDMTGMGTDITQRLKRKLGAKLEGVHFGSTIKTSQYGIKQRARDRMANNLKLLMVDDKIRLLKDDIQTRQLNSWDTLLKTCDDPDGHGDIFWACALACVDTNWKMASIGREREIILPDAEVTPVVDWGDVFGS